MLGDTGQSNKQGVVTSQMIGQDASAGIILFGGDQNAANNSATTDNSSQFIGFPFSPLILGDTAQDSGQADCTDQQIDQGADAGTLTLVGGDQNGANNGTTDKDNLQVRSAAIVPSRCARVSAAAAGRRAAAGSRRAAAGRRSSAAGRQAGREEEAEEEGRQEEEEEEEEGP